MKNETEHTIRTLKISVDCKKNDKEDVKCGGPLYLGFDFYVLEDKVDEMLSYVKQTFEDLGLYYERIYANKDAIYLRTKAWDKESIYNCIVSEANEQTFKL